MSSELKLPEYKADRTEGEPGASGMVEWVDVASIDRKTPMHYLNDVIDGRLDSSKDFSKTRRSIYALKFGDGVSLKDVARVGTILNGLMHETPVLTKNHFLMAGDLNQGGPKYLVLQLAGGFGIYERHIETLVKEYNALIPEGAV